MGQMPSQALSKFWDTWIVHRPGEQGRADSAVETPGHGGWWVPSRGRRQDQEVAHMGRKPEGDMAIGRGEEREKELR